MIYRKRHSEVIVEDLTFEECVVISAMVASALRECEGRDPDTNRPRSITAAAIAKEIRSKGWHTTTPRVRKMVNYLRLEGTVTNLVETSRGYTRARTVGDLNKYLRQIAEQLNALYAIKKAIEDHSDLVGSQRSCL